MTISEEDVTDLVNTLNGLTLPPGQRALLDAILKVVADIQERDEQAFTGEFNDAFTKKRADLVLDYVTPPPEPPTASGIFEGGSVIIRNPQAVPPGIIKGIIRNPPPDPNPDDDNDNEDNEDNENNDQP